MLCAASRSECSQSTCERAGPLPAVRQIQIPIPLPTHILHQTGLIPRLAQIPIASERRLSRKTAVRELHCFQARNSDSRERSQHHKPCVKLIPQALNTRNDRRRMVSLQNERGRNEQETGAELE